MILISPSASPSCSFFAILSTWYRGFPGGSAVKSLPAVQEHACVLSHFSCVRLFVTLWSIDSQAPLSMGFSRHEYWSGLSCPPPGDLPIPGIEPASLISPALAGGFFTTSATREAPAMHQSGFNPWLGKVPWRRKWLTTPVFLPGEFHGQKSLAGYSPWGRKEPDMTERLTLRTLTSPQAPPGKPVWLRRKAVGA